MLKGFRFFAAVVLIILSTTLLALATDDTKTETPNDPAVNPDANACYTGGSMEGKCDWPTEEETEWAWTCGWYVIRVEAGVFAESQLPQDCVSDAPTGTGCAVDDVYENNPEAPGFGVKAPGVLANDPCETSVVSHTEPVVVEGGGVTSFSIQSDGSFNYTVTAPDTIFTFTYTVEDGSTATVTIYHDIDCNCGR